MFYIVILMIALLLIYILLLKRKIKLNRHSSVLIMIIVTLFTSLSFYFGKEYYSFRQISENEVSKIIQSNLDTDIDIKMELQIESPRYVINDDNLIYSIMDNKVVIYDTNDLKSLKEITFESIKPMYLYQTESKLVVVGESDDITTEVFVYQKSDYSLDKHVQMHAKYVKGIVNKDAIYLVTSNMIDNPKQKQTFFVNQEERTIEKLYHVKNTYTNNFINLLKINLNDDEIKAFSYFGLSYSVYFTERSIYIAEEAYNQTTDRTILIKIEQDPFELTDVREIKGFMMNELSIYEKENKLFVVTTESESINHLYVLDQKMNIIHSLQNFSTGNQVQSVSFMNDYAYVETTGVSNLISVIDLKGVPKIKSEVVLAHSDTILINFIENHLIGFGYVLDEAYNPIGLKISTYRVNETVTPLSEVVIPHDDYKDAFSEVLFDTKTLLIDQEHRVIAFPVSYLDKKDQMNQEFFVYQINLENRLKQVGTIRYDSRKDLNEIKGGLIINHKLYTVTNKQIKINHLSNLKQIKQKTID